MDTRLTFRDYLGSIKTDAGTQRVSPLAQWLQGRVKRGWESEVRPAVCQEKPLRRIKISVPQTDTGGRVENTKALG